MKRHFILFSSPSQTPQITWSLIEQSFYHCSLGLINFNDYTCIAKNIIRYMYICIFIFLNTMHSFIYYLTVFTFTFLHVFLSKVDILVCSVLRNAGTLVWCKFFFMFSIKEMCWRAVSNVSYDYITCINIWH